MTTIDNSESVGCLMWIIIFIIFMALTSPDNSNRMAALEKRVAALKQAHKTAMMVMPPSKE